MRAKPEQKNIAIKLRKLGLSYGEILKRVSVSKSSLSLWLKNVALVKRQRQRLIKKKLAGMKKGWEARRATRINSIKEIIASSIKEIGGISNRELWLIGAALYWGEGSKEKNSSPGCGVRFSNSDPAMIKFFLRWLMEIIKVPKENIYFEIYIHDNYRNRLEEIARYWSEITDFPANSFERTYFKKNKISTNRKNIGKKYHGLVRIMVRRSSNLNRKIQGWIEGINNYCGVV